MRREGGFTGTLPPPVPDKPEGISRGHREAAIYRREPGSPGWWRLSHPARSPVMSLQSSKEHKVNGMTTTAVCSPHPNPLPGGARGLLSARINLWGTLSPVGEGVKPHDGSSCTAAASRQSLFKRADKPRHVGKTRLCGNVTHARISVE